MMIWKLSLTLVVVLSTLLGLPQTAWAQDVPATGTPMGELLLMVLKFVGISSGLLAAWAAFKGVRFLEAKTQFDVPASVEARLGDWVDEGIGYAYERSHHQIQKLGKKLSGPEKLQTATAYVVRKIRQNGWDERAEEWIRERIEARLGLLRSSFSSSISDMEMILKSNEPPSPGADTTAEK